jgi:hypothetical protein
MELPVAATMAVGVAWGHSGPRDFSGPLTSDCIPKKRVQVVVARYAEDLRWLRFLPFHDVVVYDKNDAGDATHGSPPRHARVERLPNVGRCDHTYLHHICVNYDNLADITLFVPGSVHTFKSKWSKLRWVVEHVCRTGDSAFPVDESFSRPVHVALADFKMECYRATDSTNAAVNPEAELRASQHRPFGKFYEAMFPDLPPVRDVVYQSVFAVSRSHVQRRPLQVYQALCAQVDSHSNPEAGHYMERSWLAMFWPVPRACMRRADWGDMEFQSWAAFLACCAVVAMFWRRLGTRH